jgi:DNA-binding response OmpR family regulator
MIQYYLEMEGFHNLISTDNSSAAFSLIESHRPDLVLSDIHMPEVSGLDLLSQIRGHQEMGKTPVVILTASSDNETKILPCDRGQPICLPSPSIMES